MERTPTSAELLALWELGEGERPGSRALVLLGEGAPALAAAQREALPVGRRDAFLLELRQRLFGDRFQGVTTCPFCDDEIEISFEASEVHREPAQATTGRVEVDGIVVDFRLPTGGDLAAIEALDDVATARARLLVRCVERATRGGDAISLDTLPAAVGAAIAARMAELDPQADVTLDVACPGCAREWHEPFDVVSFLWGELASRSRRLIGDVHTLARAYGWAEHEILGLSPRRRNAYLELLR